MIADHGERNILVNPIFARFPKGHDFDQRHIHATRVSPFDHGRYVRHILIPERDRVDLDFQANRERGVYTFQDLGQVAPPSDLGEACRIQRVQ